MLSSEDVRENPGTLVLAASWAVLFALILLVQWRSPASPATGPWWEPLKVSTTTSHRFGDSTWREIRRGQYWRLVTATFVHFGLIHVAFNTLGLINLGRLVEPWYRTGPFLAVCLAIGGLGNYLGGALRQLSSVARPWLASVASARHLPNSVERFLRGSGGQGFSEVVHTGGGSTILLGLLALGAVVGWRSRTRIGAHLQKQMILLLALTAALGVAMSGLVDNYGHLGGAIIGGLIGLIDRPLLRLSGSGWFRGVSWALVLGVSTACLGLAIRDDRSEAEDRHQIERVVTRGRAAEITKLALERLHVLFASEVFRTEPFHAPPADLDPMAMVELLSRGPKVPELSKVDPEQAARDRVELARVLDALDRAPGDLWGEPVATDLARLRALGRDSLERPPGFFQVYEFVVDWVEAKKAISADMARLNARFVELEAARQRGR